MPYNDFKVLVLLQAAPATTRRKVPQGKAPMAATQTLEAPKPKTPPTPADGWTQVSRTTAKRTRSAPAAKVPVQDALVKASNTYQALDACPADLDFDMSAAQVQSPLVRAAQCP